MSLYESVLKRLLKEAQLDLGDVQFSPNRTDGALRSEPNTPDEERIFRALKGWVSSATVDPNDINDIKNLMSSPKYGKFFKEPPRDAEVYRGIKVTQEVIAGWSGMPVDVLKDEDDADANFTINLKDSSGGFASWTHDLSVAEDFAWGSGKATKRGNYGVVLVASVGVNPGTFLDFHDMRTKLSGFPVSSTWEQEVLALGPVRVSELAWKKLRD